VLQDGNGEEQELIQQNLIILWEYRWWVLKITITL
jgi:hypothetical protein